MVHYHGVLWVGVAVCQVGVNLWRKSPQSNTEQCDKPSQQGHSTAAESSKQGAVANASESSYQVACEEGSWIPRANCDPKAGVICSDTRDSCRGHLSGIKALGWKMAFHLECALLPLGASIKLERISGVLLEKIVPSRWLRGGGKQLKWSPGKDGQFLLRSKRK